MRIRTNLKASTVYRTLAESEALRFDGGAGSYARLYFAQFEEGKSRTHEVGLSVKLGGYYSDWYHVLGPLKGTRGGWRRRINDGTDNYAATRDEWGVFLSALFEADPDIIAGPYKGRDDFHLQTKGHYLPGEGVVVHLNGAGYERYVRVPLPESGSIDEFWDEVFPFTGGAAGRDYVEVTITDAPGNPAELVGTKTTWEG